MLISQHYYKGSRAFPSFNFELLNKKAKLIKIRAPGQSPVLSERQDHREEDEH